MARKLYIIGNGFDLWHGIPSSLAQFKEYVQEHARDIYRDTEEYLPTNDDWSDLEMALASIDVDSIIDNLGHFMGSYGADDWSESGHHDFQYEVDNVVGRLSSGLHDVFAEWVCGLPIPNQYTTENILATLDSSAMFFTFNYTSTLSDVYGINSKQILFIHGCAEESKDELVLGHAWHPQERSSLNDRTDIEDIDIRLMEANSTIDSYFSSTFKRSAELIAENQHFFNRLHDVEQVIVLGHSLSVVDAIYFRELLKQPSLAIAQWLVACRSDDEWPEKLTLLTDMGLDPARVSPVKWGEI